MADTAPDDAHLAPVSSLRSRFEQPTQQTHKARASESMSLGHGRVPIAAATAVGRRVASTSHAVTEDPEERPPSTRSAFVSRPAPPPPPPTAPRPQILSAPASVNDLNSLDEAQTSVSALRGMFGNVSGSTPTLNRSPSPLHQSLTSSSSSSQTTLVPPPIPNRSTMASPRIALTRPTTAPDSSPDPIASSSSSIGTAAPMRQASISPPPLPIRHNTGGSSSGASASGVSDREEASSSGTSNCSEQHQHQHQHNALLRPAPPPPVRLAVKPPLPSRRQANGSSGSVSPSDDMPLPQPPPLPSRRSPTGERPPPLPSRPPVSPTTPTSGGLPPMLPARSVTPKPPPPPTRTPVARAVPTQLPPRQSRPPVSNNSSASSATSLPPPPTRFMAPGASLPPLQKRSSTNSASGGSSSDEGEEDPEDIIEDLLEASPIAGPSRMPVHTRRQTLFETMPDSSTASRRPPMLSGCPTGIRVPTSNGQAVVAVCGRLVVFGIGFGLVIWDTVAGVEQFNLDSKHLGLKDKDRVTAAAFRPALDEEPGRYVWVGTKEGHLLELDAWTGRVVDVRAAIHSGAVLRMVRGGAELVTVDDAGKALRWVCARGTNGASMLRQAARLVRLAERGVPTWVGLWGGWLWVASSGAAAPHPKSSTKSGLGKLKDLASGASSSTPSLSSGATSAGVVRVYDLSGGPTLPFVLKMDSVPGVGAVHCGSMLMSTPGLVYLGHEGGVVSVWSFAADNGVDELLISPLQSALSNSSTYSLPSLHSTSSSDSTSSLTSPPPSNLKRRTPPSLEYSVKVGSSDVFTLDGIAARLWVGSRKGTITAYDPSDGAHRPWRATNIWQATGTGSESSDDTAIAVGKEGLPVVHVGLDLQPGATRLAVHSVGRDSVLRFWDGLLGANARNTALDGREEAFCEYRQVRAMVCTWNVGAAKADTLFDHTNGGNVAGNRRFLDDLVRDAQAPEIVVFGFQEVVDLDDRAVTAKTVLLGKNKPKSNGAAANGNTVLTEVESHITPRYRAWQDAMARALARALPGTPYAVVAVQQLVGLFSVAFVRRDQMGEGMGLRDVAVGVVKRGLGGRWGNKGAVAVRFVLDDSSICLVNCHLAAGQKHIQQRNADIAAILEDRAALPVSGGDGYDQDGDLRSPGGGAVAYVGGGDGSMILDHEIVLLHGDLNYRIDARRDAVLSHVRSRELGHLASQDQLVKQLRNNPTFRLRTAGFVEASSSRAKDPSAPDFDPTYKYDRHSTSYDSSHEKPRSPAWCDRILARCHGRGDRVRCEPGSYRRWEVDVSDHRPVSAVFALRVRRVDWQRREREVRKAAVEQHTREQEMMEAVWRWEGACGRV